MPDVKILLVEDESIEALDIKGTLESYGYQVPYVAAYGEEAILKAKEIIPDIILLDIILKGQVNGIDVASEIKSLDIPIIYLTAHSEESTIERAKFTGPYGYLIKPFDPLILKNTIELALSKHEMEQRLRGVIHGSPIPQFVLDKNHEVIYWNRSLEKYSGIKSKEVIGTKDHWKAFYDKKRPCMVDLLLDGDLEDLSQWYHGKYKKSEVLEDAYEGTDFFPKLGKTGKWLYFTATTIKNFKGEITGAIETLEDVTDRKDAELELKTNEAKFRNILENLQDAYIQSDMYGNVLMASPSAAKMYGYDSPQEMIGIATELLFKNPEDRISMLEKIKKQGMVGDFEGEGRKKDGASFWASVNAQFYCDDHGQIQGLETFVRDISERKNSEKALKQSEERFRALIYNSTDIIRILDREGHIIFDSPSSQRILGYPKGFFIGKNPLDFIHPDDRAQVKEDLNEVYQDRNPGIPTEFRIQKADGEYFSVETISQNMIDVPGVEGVVVTTHPVQARKEMEEALRDSEEKYRTLFESDPDYTILLDLNGIILDLNNAALDFIGVTREKLIGEDFTGLGLFPEDDAVLQLENFRIAIENRTVQVFQCKIFNKRGGHSWIELKLVPLEKDGKIYAVLAIATDITEMMITTDKLKDSLLEKEVLIKEIHHRVKNNMQIISSLLNLQMQYVDDEIVVDILKESQNRVRSMAMIHEKLYQSPDLTSIKFDDYVQRLVSELFYSYHIPEDRIRSVINVEDVVLNIETAIPCGLIISELVSNSLKHAFPEGIFGEVVLSLKPYDTVEGGDYYELKISDTGIGFPEDLDFENTESLGLKLVNTLVIQLNGDIKLDRSHGTQFKIVFKRSEYEKRY